MRYLSWNCRGIRNSRTVQELRKLVKQEDPDLIFLMETKVETKQIDWLKMGLGMYGCAVDCVGLSGGLALLWKKDRDVTIQSLSRSHIDATVKAGDAGPKW